MLYHMFIDLILYRIHFPIKLWLANSRWWLYSIAGLESEMPQLNWQRKIVPYTLDTNLTGQRIRQIPATLELPRQFRVTTQTKCLSQGFKNSRAAWSTDWYAKNGMAETLSMLYDISAEFDSSAAREVRRY